MEPRPGSETALARNLQIVAVPASSDPERSRSAGCLRCGGTLDIHQPDAHAPERMLATCHACGAWHLVDCPSDGSALIALLPDLRSHATLGDG